MTATTGRSFPAPERRYVVEAVLIAAVLVAVVVVFGAWRADGRSALAVGVGMVVAAGLYRLAPAVALLLVWASCSLQVWRDLDVMAVQAAALLVAFGAARHGRAATVWVSGLSLPLAGLIALAFYERHDGQLPALLSVTGIPGGSRQQQILSAFVLVVAVLGVPWIIGLVLRLNARYQLSTQQRQRAEQDQLRAQEETRRAQEVADLRADQARLARDVHDVVGHSLAVIVAQADSAQFLPDADIEKIRAAMANIATSARQSLGDVRRVLTTTHDPGAAAEQPPGDLDRLIDGARTPDDELVSRVEGSPQPLPPELAVVAYRVLQEMLTNALKHGRRGTPITVVREWGPQALRIEVRNAAPAAARASGDGMGLVGMERRLESVGGRLAIRSEQAGDGVEFTATAWLPVRAGER